MTVSDYDSEVLYFILRLVIVAGIVFCLLGSLGGVICVHIVQCGSY